MVCSVRDRTLPINARNIHFGIPSRTRRGCASVDPWRFAHRVPDRSRGPGRAGPRRPKRVKPPTPNSRLCPPDRAPEKGVTPIGPLSRPVGRVHATTALARRICVARKSSLPCQSVRLWCLRESTAVLLLIRGLLQPRGNRGRGQIDSLVTVLCHPQARSSEGADLPRNSRPR